MGSQTEPELKPGAPRNRARRVRQTRSSVRIVEHVARALISLAGLGTILAVAMICLFLLWIAAPLFFPAKIGAVHEQPRSPAPDGSTPLRLEVDEYQRIAAALESDGTLEARRLDTGELLERVRPFGAHAPTAVSFVRGAALFGFEDGSLRYGRIGFEPRNLAPEEIPAEQRGLVRGAQAVFENGLLERTVGDGFRWQKMQVALEEPMASTHTARALLVDHTSTATQRRIAAFYADRTVALYGVDEQTNLMTGETTRSLTEGRVPYKVLAERGDPDHLVLASGGSSLYLIWRDGFAQRFDTRDYEKVRLAESVDLVPEESLQVTAVTPLLGETSLAIGDSSGRTCVWFPTRPADASTSDKQVLARAHVLLGAASPVSAIRPSERTRLVAIGHADGEIEVFYASSARRIAHMQVGGGESVQALAITPKEDGLVALTAGRLWNADFDAGHPEAGIAGIFTPVWYETYSEPQHIWQSSSASDEAEPKLGMTPLIFGTLKASFYSLLFGVPLALLAAIYSSEFLNPRLRVPIKSGIEMMASLPSVVLGFFAAFILAPFVQAFVPAVIAAFFAIPLALLGGAHLWQLIPARLALRWADLQRFAFIALCLPLGVWLAIEISPLLNRMLFGGDIKQWLNGGPGGALGGWWFLLLPLAAAAVAFMVDRHVSPRLRAVSLEWSRAACARAEIGLFAAGTLASVLLALLGASLLSALGFDARGTLVGTYVQRNSLIVGFVMGFAIIPIIYTLAEDALASVPSHLRLASLGCGATPWQTAVRVIIPTAMSGLFSAVMIGLGRAVGETMIVLMAAGNTAVMDMNVFSGFRTLSANIATELPEAVRNSTHYRMLFLAALTLFAITFLVNTAAEVVRQRFRKRAFML